MDIVTISTASGSISRRRERSGRATRVPLLVYAELRAPMIFLIADMGYKIRRNPLKINGAFFPNRKFARVSRVLPGRFEYGKTEPSPLRECAKIDCFPLQERLFPA
jgi:hypothetical protein